MAIPRWKRGIEEEEKPSHIDFEPPEDLSRPPPTGTYGKQVDGQTVIVTPEPEPPTTYPSVYESDAWAEYQARRAEERGEVPPSTITPPPEPPPWGRSGGTATISELREVGVPSRGIIPIGTPEPPQIEIEGSATLARYYGEKKTEELVSSFEETYQPSAQDFTQQRYNELMADKARQLGMRGEYDPSTGTVIYRYTSNEQLASWQDYQGVAETIAVSEGQKYYSDLWTQKDIEKKAIDIYKEEYANQALMMVERGDGTYNVIKRSEYEKQQRYEKHKIEWQKKLEKEPIPSILLIGAGAFTKHDLLFTRTLGEVLFGKEVGKRKRVFEISAEAQFGFREAMKGKGNIVSEYLGVTSKMFEPGSPVFTFGAAYLAGMGFGTAIGGIAQLSPMVAKGVQIGAGGYFLGRSAKEIETIATTGRTIEWGGLLGLAPVGLSQQAQVMSEAERFSSIAMFGGAAAFGIAGYAKGLKLGRQFMAGIYKPKHVEVRTVFPKLEKVAESDYGIAFKGMIKYQSTRIRTFFGKELPWSKEVYSADLAVKGILGKKPVSFIDPKTGKTAVWRPGEALYTLEKGMLYKQIFGITLSKKYPGGGIYKAYPSRPMKVDVSKKMGVDIEPYIKQTKLATIFTEKPSMSLMLTQSQLASELFKPIVKSKFYPSEAKNIIKGNIVETKTITQMWKLLDSKKLMELISVKKFPIVEKTKETYKLTPFRQVSKTETPTSLIIGKTFGISALLKTREPIIEKPYKPPTTSTLKLYTKQIDPIKPVSSVSSIPSIYKKIRTDEPIKLEGKPSTRYKTPKSSLILEEEVSLVYPPDVDIASLFGTKTLPIYATGTVSDTKQDDLTRWNMAQTQLFEKLFKQKDTTRFEEMQLQRLGLGELPASLLGERPKLGQRQAQTYLQAQAQMQKLLTQQMTTSVTVTPPVVTPIVPIVTLMPTEEKIKEIEKPIPNIFSEQGYIVRVKHKTYQSGKRIRPDKYDIDVNKYPYGLFDAMVIGHQKVDNTPKASFVLIPVEGKPRKSRKKNINWLEIATEIKLNKKGQYVEQPPFRIDSQGELEGITLKGIAANKRKGGKSRSSNKTFSGVDKDFGKVNKMVEKTMKRFMKKAGVF